MHLRSLLTAMLLFTASADFSFALDCKNQMRRLLSTLSERLEVRMRNVQYWVETSRTMHAKHLGEPIVHLQSLESARNYVYDFPGLEHFGFGDINKLNWAKVIGRMEISASKGKAIGWQRKLDSGDWARVRLDYSPEVGAHYNLEIRVHNQAGHFETHDLAVAFLCSDHPCSESDYRSLLKKLN